MPEVVDLRSDTVTRPTDAMRDVMAGAEVGDDVLGDDPTVNRLQERAAEIFDREAALFTPSGIMANQLALRVLADHATEVVIEADAHIVNYEAGAGAALAGVQFRTVVGDRGRLDPADVAEAIRPDAYHLTPTSLITVEQSHNRHGGTVYALRQLEDIAALARRHHVNLYLDGARVFNAAAATGVEPAVYGRLVDGLMFSLSKGLGAPIGSVLVADAEHIDVARTWRQRHGGAMRQAGIIAAAGLYALDHHVERLTEDHINATMIAETIAEADPDAVDLDAVQTNMVYVHTGAVDARELAEDCADEGILFDPFGPDTIRLVTHLDVDRAGCRRAADTIAAALA